MFRGVFVFAHGDSALGGKEGIPPAIRCLWDRNAKDLLRFETMMSATGHIMRTLTKAIGGEKAEKAPENRV